MESSSAGRVILIRHAQASFGSANYDQLSQRGEQQAQRLAAWLVAHPELNFSHVATGTLRRHAQTLAAIDTAFAADQRALPAVAPDADWNEFDHEALLRVYAQRRAGDPLLAAARADHRAAHALMSAVLQAWANGELDAAVPETWDAFGARVARARERLEAAPPGRITVVSSGGPIARCAQAALGCDTRRAVTLNLALRNTAVSEFRTRQTDWSLHIWNMLPHLAAPQDRDQVTYYRLDFAWGLVVTEIFALSERARDLRERVARFQREAIEPAEAEYFLHLEQPGQRWTIPPVMENLKRQARAGGLWNLFLPSGLSNLDYAPLAEIMGRSLIAPEVFNCNAPDTGNMEVLAQYGSPAQQAQWLEPLLDGAIRSAFAMTEPEVASSDATNIATRIARDGDSYVVDGHKWWTSGACDPRCAVFIVMGVTNPDAESHRRHAMILVPRTAPGVDVIRPLSVFGFDDAPHGHAEVRFERVRVPTQNLILGEGRGFEIAQGRLGPGRIHHCMRLIGLAQRALDSMLARATSRVAFGKPLAAQGMVQQAIAESRCEIEQARLLTLAAADALDRHGNKAAKDAVGMIKIVAPRMACTVIDRAIQIHGGLGVCQDSFLAHAYAAARALRLADGPDEVHIAALARTMLKPERA